MGDSYPEIGNMDDRTELIQSGEGSKWSSCLVKTKAGFKRHKVCAITSIVLALILLANGLAVYFIYFQPSVGIKIMALNTWGMPATFGSYDKTERMKGIAAEIAKAEHDLILLEELWMEPDHTAISKSVPKGYYMTGFRQLALSTCDGRVGPEACSGLAVISKYPFEEVEFNSYTYHGDMAKMFIDGEWLARKGVGRVRIHPAKGYEVDVFVTHTAADPDPSHGYNNSYYRTRQVKELMDTYILKSKADFVILGGDFNAPPDDAVEETYKTVRQWMKNSIEEIFYKLNQWLNPHYATYGNVLNTWSGVKYSPVIYDYIFHRTNNNLTSSWTNWFEMPFFKLFEPQQNRSVSFSDHEAVVSTIYLRKFSDKFPYL